MSLEPSQCCSGEKVDQMLNELLQKIETRTARVGVVGLLCLTIATGCVGAML